MEVDGCTPPPLHTHQMVTPKVSQVDIYFTIVTNAVQATRNILPPRLELVRKKVREKHFPIN